MTNSVHRLATEYRNAGISVIPLRLDLDGSKAPSITSWQPYQQRLTTDGELSQWFSRPAGVGMVAGDDGSLFQSWRAMVVNIVDCLPVVETPSGGWHVLYRCTEVGGNIKIAKDPSREKKTLIETRGEGGYVVAEGSPCATHATGLPYVQYSGPYLPEIPRITPVERRELWRAARTFDRAELAKEVLRKQRAQAGPAMSSDVHPVVTRYCERLTWDSLLTRHGWSSSDGVTWTRPCKSFGTSARLVAAQDGSEVLTVFSANAGPLSPTGSHRSCSLVALEFNSDGKAAFAAAKQEAVA